MLVKAPDSQYLKARYINEEHNIELGIYPVIFGWRIHAGYIGDFYYHIDYCCGDKKDMVEFLLSVVKNILEKNNYDFKVLPNQNIKPVFNDRECFPNLIELAGTFEKLEEVPDLYILRYEIMKEMFSVDPDTDYDDHLKEEKEKNDTSSKS